VQVTYDAHTDTLTIVLRDEPVNESDEEKPGIILDYNAAGEVVSFEILDASRRVAEPNQMIYRVAGSP
jgi:uncharacterized protein YuzE